MSDPDDLAAAGLVLALRRAIPLGVSVMREAGGYRVVSADGKVSVIVFDDGSTSPLSDEQRTPPVGHTRERLTSPREDFEVPLRLRRRH